MCRCARYPPGTALSRRFPERRTGPTGSETQPVGVSTPVKRIRSYCYLFLGDRPVRWHPFAEVVEVDPEHLPERLPGRERGKDGQPKGGTADHLYHLGLIGVGRRPEGRPGGQDNSELARLVSTQVLRGRIDGNAKIEGRNEVIRVPMFCEMANPITRGLGREQLLEEHQEDRAFPLVHPTSASRTGTT